MCLITIPQRLKDLDTTLAKRRTNLFNGNFNLAGRVGEKGEETPWTDDLGKNDQKSLYAREGMSWLHLSCLIDVRYVKRM